MSTIDLVAAVARESSGLSVDIFSGGPMSTPSVGLRRRYHCSTLHDGGKFLLCGSDVGDLVVFG